MAKSKVKPPKPKPPENAPTVVKIRKIIVERKTALGKRKEGAMKDGKLNRVDPKYRLALKRLKRAQRKLQAEAYRLVPKRVPVIAEAAPAAAPASAPAEASAPVAVEEKK